MSIFPINRGGGGKSAPLSLFAVFTDSLCILSFRTGCFLTGLFFCALLLTAPVTTLAQTQTPPEAGNGDSAAAPKTQIITDEDKGTVTIVIDGKPVVQIDKDGLRVVGNVEYGGTLTDTGSAYIEKAIAGGDDAE